MDEIRDTAPRCRLGLAASTTADVVLLAGEPTERTVLLVRRSHAPFAGSYALPGGFVEKGEQPLQAALRELREETGISAVDLAFIGSYDGAVRDPRLTTSHAYGGCVTDALPAAASSDAAEAEWLSVDLIASGAVALAFDHVRVLRDAIEKEDASSSRYLGDLERVAKAADNRNAKLLLEVERYFGRGAVTDTAVLLAEYTALKAESTQRIQQRDGFINLNLLAVAAVASFVANSHAASFALLAIPWASLCFGWVYLANDEKISALADYCEHHLGPKLGDQYLAWERSPKRATSIKGTHKTTQLVVDLLQFVVPAIGAPIALWIMNGFGDVWVNLVGAVEIVFGVGLGILFLLSSHLTKRFDFAEEEWRSL